MFTSLLNLLGSLLPAAQHHGFLTLMAVYVDRTSTVAMRQAAYRGMWNLVARGLCTAAVEGAKQFIAGALRAAGSVSSTIANVLAQVGAFLAGTGGTVILAVLAGVLLAVLIWMTLEWLSQRGIEHQRQQNMELDRNTRKLFGGARPIPYAVLVNNPMSGPMEVIRTGRPQLGCA
ncbi:MAG: hypothetical protein JNL98_13795 [Bryobacterales bacterium]|nr:hypothetical protein [Bryobacterales bacterium]